MLSNSRFGSGTVCPPISGKPAGNDICTPLCPEAPLDSLNGESEKPRYIRMLQLDFCSEVKPGTLLEFSRGEEFGLLYLRGTKPDGTVAFIAACVY